MLRFIYGCRVRAGAGKQKGKAGGVIARPRRLPFPFTVRMALESLQFPTPRLVTAATFFKPEGSLICKKACWQKWLFNENKAGLQGDQADGEAELPGQEAACAVTPQESGRAIRAEVPGSTREL